MKVVSIFIHPVKSLKGIEVQESEVGPRGFQYDRVYMLATPTSEQGVYRHLTQRREPSMALIETSLDGRDLVLKSPVVQRELRIPADPDMLPKGLPGGVNVDIWGTSVECLDVCAGLPEVKKWFQEALDSKYNDVTLLAPLEYREVQKDMPPEFAVEAGRRLESLFQDEYPGHLVTTASMEELQRRVDVTTGGAVQITPQKFRPNIVIETDEPYVEDDWRRIQIGEHEWLVPNAAVRCSIPSVNPKTGVVEKSREPVPSMTKYRVLNPGEPPSFGMNMVNKDKSTKVRVGDIVKVLELDELAL